jgi:glycosyltransferase involved in cell wall biosynthesis
VPDIPLVIAGNDEENYKPEIEALSASHGVSDRVTFTGPVYGDDKAALLQNATVLILPSYSENFGNVVLEAMAVGCPVVVTPEVGVADIILKYKAGMVINGEPETLGKELQHMASNPQELKKMGERGRQTVEEHFTWSSVGAQMGEMYNDTIAHALGNS